MKKIRLAAAVLALIPLVLIAPVRAGLLDTLHLGSGETKYLEPDKAFALDVTARDPYTLIARFRVTPKYYLYRSKVKFTLVAPDASIERIAMPRGKIKHDRYLGDLEVFHQSFQAALLLKRTGQAAEKVVLQATYQGCSEEGLCYQPIDKTFTVALPAATGPAPSPDAFMQSATAAQAGDQTAAPSGDQNDSSRIASLFRQGNFWLIISFFFGAGLLLAFTPCVFPMVPILSGIIVGRGHRITHLHGFILSLAYVLGMAITYAVAGVAAGFSGTMLSSALQTPWVLGAFAAIFVALALSMFGFYELQLPTALQSRLATASNKLHGGHLAGVFVMGALSAIIVGPCVAAPLAGALLYIGQTHDAFLGGSALFFMALGMGVPLLLIGASAGTLLPKAGAWMESVKRLFGVLLLAVAIWIISPLIPVSVEMLMWAVLLVLSAVFLHALDALPHNASHWHKLWKGCGILALLLGIAYLVGALSGAQDVLRPLSVIGSARAEAPATLKFTRVRSIADLDARLAQAAGRPVMLDFWAEWCVSCKEMERNTFADPKIQARLQNAMLLQVDVTADSADDKALLARYHLFGPPATLFFGHDGEELASARVTGYQDSTQFQQSLQAAGL
ncbi:MAG TPA: protein-disulfide reductase DsbD [Gallionellaceae bacterium]|nr:protein-disulfide reductase DsbD [Gallionellaceae bacterium]